MLWKILLYVTGGVSVVAGVIVSPMNAAAGYLLLTGGGNLIGQAIQL